METNRANLDEIGHKSSYIILAVVFIILSIIGFIVFIQIRERQTKSAPTVMPITGTPRYDNKPTQTPAAKPSLAVASPTPTISIVNASPTPTVPIDTISPTPTPEFTSFSSASEKFSLTHKTSRTVYTDKEGTGTRYTFYNPNHNFAVHVGADWSWLHPGRQFTTTFTLDSQPTFRYDIDSQTIVDVKYGNFLYTFQCIHQGLASYKAECTSFLNSVKFLK